MFYLNGQLLTYTADYTISGTTLVISSDRPAPTYSDILKIYGSTGYVEIGNHIIITVNTSLYSITDYFGDRIILCNYSSGNCIINLPSAINYTDKITIKKIDSSSYSVTVIPQGTETIDLDTSKTILYQFTSFSIISDGNNWFIV